MNLPQQKQHLRSAIMERINRLRPEERTAEGRSLSKQILKALPQEKDLILCAYFPIRDEPDIREFLKSVLERGWHLYLPRFESNKLVFRRATDLSHMKPGKFSIPEPPVENDLLDVTKLQYAIVPGKAFTKSGQRMGRGNGGYDRWLSDAKKKNPSLKIYGAAYDCQIVHEVPMEAHDETVDAVITARGIIRG